MNRAELQQLAEDRVLDAQALLAAQRSSGAYYLAGYAVECGLKSCVLAWVARTGIIFDEKRFCEKCWTHDIEELVTLADLQAARGSARAANPVLARNWTVVTDWNETSRYQQKTPAEAQKLVDAITDSASGVLPWIEGHW
jgi:hypothetical protein